MVCGGSGGVLMCAGVGSVDLIARACAAHEGKIVPSLSQCGEA